MKVLLLSDLNSVHTQRWAEALVERGIEVDVVGLQPLTKPSVYYDHAKIHLHHLLDAQYGNKLGYLLGIPKLKKIINQTNPDIVHAHYATSYGLLGALTKGQKPYFLSVWGDDLLIFPKESYIHKLIVIFNLNQADQLFATSEALVNATKNLLAKKVTRIPFGVDLEKFSVGHKQAAEEVVIGTIKGLEDIYGIDILIKSFSILKQKYSDKKLKLLIVGSGSKETELKTLCRNLKIEEQVVFTGKVDHHKIAEYHQKIDIFTAFSRSESFGVSVVEAQSLGIPAVVSNVGGLPEIVEDQVTGLVVPKENPEAAAQALEKLLLNPALRTHMGNKGRERVVSLFSWNKNADEMCQAYYQLKGHS